MCCLWGWRWRRWGGGEKEGGIRGRGGVGEVGGGLRADGWVDAGLAGWWDGANGGIYSGVDYVQGRSVWREYRGAHEHHMND